MDHIGIRIREARREKGWSAEMVGRKMKKAISKQAFAQKERNGSFSYQEVEEVAEILGVNMKYFLPKRSIKNLPNSTDPHPAA